MMKKSSLLERCHVNTNIENDVFVGIRKKTTDDIFEISFPLGYHLSGNEKELRRDILSLLNVLSKFSDKKESEFYQGVDYRSNTEIPVQAYLYMIKDYFERGYYKERESHYEVLKKGKIDWRRTIKKQRPVVDENELYYLNYVVKKNSVSNDELITIVHKYCVYESFNKFGWLFTAYVPSNPKNSLTVKHMTAVVKAKIQDTFNDKNRQLFINMLAILNSVDLDTNNEFRYGTNRFEYVWEKMIDYVFGISGKEKYFPKSIWKLTNGEHYENSELEPDSIMMLGEKIYVLDAKYYKFGATGFSGHLPGTSSINKQITYGEYIAENTEISERGCKPIVYNAFIMPYDSKSNKFRIDKNIFAIGNAECDWKDGSKEYEKVVGILMDARYLIQLGARLDYNAIMELSTEIEKCVPNCK